MTQDISTQDTLTAPERRDYDRLPLRAYAELSHATERYEAHLIDISQFGAKIALLVDHAINPGDDFTLTLEPENLPDALSQQLPLSLQAKAVHIKQHILGIRCQPADEADVERFNRLLSLL
ncbi:PilZ domain-containing protein [Gilvimarinus sp. 1_MG-2023]|uniref:PilZ domain-containing protein n=1 Tax=Gilvimarinus sp. 1_MG-2023 TaxID=3062638 RepID=UPI0026E410CD|nr:PilZ domain-containing protein [Gilvimarinus sp. 1_MG-2023]MDO6746419.1 PilZ domain-containing protein [Gilvimarinus sp. 1_MG-2023]